MNDDRTVDQVLAEWDGGSNVQRMAVDEASSRKPLALLQLVSDYLNSIVANLTDALTRIPGFTIGSWSMEGSGSSGRFELGVGEDETDLAVELSITMQGDRLDLVAGYYGEVPNLRTRKRVFPDTDPTDKIAQAIAKDLSLAVK